MELEDRQWELIVVKTSGAQSGREHQALVGDALQKLTVLLELYAS